MAEENQDKDYKAFDAKRTDLKPIHDRQDVDEALYFLKPYKMMMLDKPSEEMPDVANVTLNDCLLYAVKAISILSGATMQPVIEGRKLTDKQTTSIEEFLADVYYMVDDWLENKGIWGLGAFTDEQIMIRGHVGARPCLRIGEEGLLIPDVTPLDTRFFAPELGDSGIVWGAPWFFQTKEELEREYNKPGDVLPHLEDSENEVVDRWDSEENKVFVNRELARSQPNTYGYPPFVYSVVHAGSMFYSKDAVEHRGESILWANRELWTEKNRTATILQTINVNALFAAIQLEVSKPGQAKKPKTSPYKPRSVQIVEKGGGFRAMPVSDIKRATTLFYSILESDLQRGSLAAIDYGTLTFPLSSLAMAKLMGSRNDLFLPRVNTKAVYYQALSRMLINQCIQFGVPIRVGQRGSENEYKPSDLEGDYTIKYRFFTESAEEKVANFTIARDASAYYSRDTVRRDYLHDKDPDGEELKFQSQQAEMLDEVVFLHRRARALAEPVKKGEKVSAQDKIDSYLLTQRGVTILKQRNAMGKLSQLEADRFPEVTAESKGKTDLAATNEGGGGAGQAAGIGKLAQRPSMLTRAPTAEEAIEEAEYE
jgi:hypothetical protein